MFNKCKSFALCALLLVLFSVLAGCGSSSESTATISGKVTVNGTGLANVTVSAAGAISANTVTDSNGNYTFAGLPKGGYTITPSIAGYSFTPLSQVVTAAGGITVVPDFTATATPVTYTISGKVSYNGSGLPNVVMAITGAGSGSLITNATGNFTFTGVRNGDYTLIPSLAGYAFSPASNSFSVNDANIAGQDFTAVQGGSITITF